jgi:acyl-CoA thioesterase-2
MQSLQLERIEENLFRGTTPRRGPDRIYGGQVIAQSLLAAYATVEGRNCHSLHAYFIRPGDSSAPIVFEIDRSRDGGSFTTRRVIAVQHGKQIFNMAASFMDPEQGFEHQARMPDAPSRDGFPDEMGGPSPIQMRRTDGRSFFKAGEPGEPESLVWFRARDPIGPDQTLHQVACAYASDLMLLATAMHPHGVHWGTKGLQAASLDHALWFHRPMNFNDWHLYAQDSPSASGGRGFIRGSIFAEDGTLVASVAQEALIRMRPAKS